MSDETVSGNDSPGADSSEGADLRFRGVLTGQVPVKQTDKTEPEDTEDTEDDDDA